MKKKHKKSNRKGYDGYNIQQISIKITEQVVPDKKKKNSKSLCRKFKFEI